MSDLKSTELLEIHHWDEIPTFQSEAEEAEFWDTHSLGDELLAEMSQMAEDVTQVSYPPIEMQKILKLLNNLLVQLVNAISKLPKQEMAESDRTIEKFLRLLRRHIEGILHLASIDIKLLPPALAIARTVIDTFANFNVVT